MVFSFAEYELDVEQLELRESGRLVHADAMVLRLLACLVKHPGRLVTKDELVDEVWEGRAIADNAITVSVARLRKLLGHRRGSREIIVTTYGRGYRFVPQVVQREPQAEPIPYAAQGGGRSERPLLVGREPVLAQLRQALSQARGERGALCVLMGEPGIGKTSVAEAFARELTGQNIRVAWGFCREAGDTPPLWPWQRLLAEVALARPDSEPPAREPQAPGSTQWDGPARHRAFESILTELRRAAARQRWVLIIDDLHRADAASLELLSNLLDELAQIPLLVIATLRHSLGRLPQRPDTHLPTILGHRNCQRITLGRLQDDEVSSYVASLLDDPDPELVRAVFAKSEGNPFFMAELVRAVRDLPPGAPELLAIPPASLDLIRQRLARLAPEVRHVLTAAAVVGRSFELPLLAAVTGQEPSKLMTSLDDALEAELVIAAPGSTSAFAFGHELLRSVLYEALAPQERRALHAQVARMLEQRMAAAEAVPASELAYHYHAALPDGDLHKTVAACSSAATAAGIVFANSDVVRYARHALEALDLLESPSLRVRIRLWFQIAIFARGLASADAGAAVYEVARLARELRDGGTLARAAIMYNLHPGLAPLPGASAVLEEALALLPEADLGLRGVTLAALACTPPQSYSVTRSSELLAEAEALVQAHGVPAARYTFSIFALYLRGGPGQEAAAQGLLDVLVQLTQQRPELGPALPVDLALQRAISGWQRGDLGVAVPAMERAARHMQLLRHSELLWHCERFQQLAALATSGPATGSGSSEEPLRRLEALHRQAEQQGILGTQPFCALDRALLWRGRADHPASLVDSLRGALGFDQSDPPSIWAIKVRALAACGADDEARALLRAVEPGRLAELPRDRDWLGTLGHITRAALQLEAAEYRSALYRILAAHSDKLAVGISFVCEGAVEHLLGLLARANGDAARAEAHLRAGLARHEKAGLVQLAAESRMALAQGAQS